MNLLHMKYVVSTADAGSINKAAEELHVAQPNLSRVIREMEADLGIRFFVRSSKGMTLTADGEQFVSRARKILENVVELETMYKEEKPGKARFSISVPRASYISDAFASKDSRIKVDHQLNGGVNSARARGVDSASGVYLVFLDADEYFSVATAGNLRSVVQKYHKRGWI